MNKLLDAALSPLMGNKRSFVRVQKKDLLTVKSSGLFMHLYIYIYINGFSGVLSF